MSAKNIYRNFLKVSTALFGAPFTKKMDARIRFHRTLNLKDPQTLADKLSYMELFEENPLKVKCSDKYAVREYVKEKGLESILVPLCYPVCSSPEEIDYDKLPGQFAMKATHGCAMNLICDDKGKISEKEIRELAGKWLNEDYPRACIEPHYLKIPHRVIFEEYLQNANDIVDYKFHCFHGKPDFVLTCSNRVKGLQIMAYTLEWEPIYELTGKEAGNTACEKPVDLERMLEISETLAADFDFVRVDLYDIKGKVYFGELTFSPATGVLPSFTEKFIKEKGKLLTISRT